MRRGDHVGIEAIDLQKIHSAFSLVLWQHLSRLGEEENGACPSLKRMEALTLLYLLYERESEIGQRASSSAKRYSRNTLLEEFADLFPGGGMGAKAGLDQLIADNLVSANAENGYGLTPKATEKVKAYDAVFPGMPGMSFVAYALQTIEEVVSGRKSLSAALKQFDQTLLLQGKRQKSEQLPPEKTQGPNAFSPKKTGKAPSQQQKASPPKNLQQLYRLRAERRRQKSQPTIVTRSGYTPKVEVRSLFPRKDVEGSPETSETVNSGTKLPEPRTIELAAENGHPQSGQEKLPAGPVENINTLSNKEDDNQHLVLQKKLSGQIEEAAHQDRHLTDAAIDNPEAAEQAQEKEHEAESDYSRAQEEIGAITDAETLAPSEATGSGAKVEQEGVVVRDAGDTASPALDDLPPDPVDDIENIEKRIAAFENDLAMHCPICGIGKIQAAETKRGKTYYACSDEGCNFISWGKPYHYPCPVCRNPFLIEFSTRRHGKGLKCPRATCNYWQKHLKAPSLQKPSAHSAAGQATNAGSGSRKVVRRKVVRRR